MNKFCLIILIFLLTPSVAVFANSEEARDKQQETLDQTCKQAREVKLAPLREVVIKDCVDSGKTAEYCQDFNKDYGEKMGNRAALFMDLPECVKAFDYSQSYRAGR